jgi:hypothetical protein
MVNPHSFQPDVLPEHSLTLGPPHHFQVSLNWPVAAFNPADKAGLMVFSAAMFCSS